MDYLSFTLKPYGEDNVQIAKQIIKGLDAWRDVRVDAMGKGYNYAIKMRNITIYYNSPYNDCHVVCTGKGCRDLEEFHSIDSFDGWRLFLTTVLELSSVRRWDVSYDDYEGTLQFDIVKQKAEAKEFCTRVRRMERSLSDEISSSKQGCTIYLGGKLSNFRVAIYDKASEFRMKGKQPQYDPWIRVELRHKAELAQAVIRSFIEKGESAISGNLLARLTFTDGGNPDTKRSRKPKWPGWMKFFGSTSSPRLIKEDPEPPRTLESLRRHLFNSYARVMALLDDSPEYVGWREEAYKEGRAKRTPEDEELLDESIEKHRKKSEVA